uniref:Uncharacterized protein n=1 Tax=Anguilla anguilla TaxID=7936 RepID=A0A0E9V4I1_ANGAN
MANDSGFWISPIHSFCSAQRTHLVITFHSLNSVHLVCTHRNMNI